MQREPPYSKNKDVALSNAQAAKRCSDAFTERKENKCLYLNISQGVGDDTILKHPGSTAELAGMCV
jgi:hypothetical protein